MNDAPGQPAARVFTVGTAGWTAAHLDEPEIELLWDQGRFEIVDGVLTTVPSATLDEGIALLNLLTTLQRHLETVNGHGLMALGTDVILNSMRVARADAAYLSAEMLSIQPEMHNRSIRPRGKYGRCRVAPNLIIESVCLGHDAHDRVTKRHWYSEAGVPHYWLLDAHERSLEALILRNGSYEVETIGRGNEVVRTTLFPGLSIKLETIWQ